MTQEQIGKVLMISGALILVIATFIFANAAAIEAAANSGEGAGNETY